MVVSNGSIVKTPLPALGTDPTIEAGFPMCAVRVNAVYQLKSCGVELEDGKVAKLVSVGVEELVVVDSRMLAKNPFARGIQIGLRRPPFNSIQQRVLTFVGMRKVKLVGKK